MERTTGAEILHLMALKEKSYLLSLNYKWSTIYTNELCDIMDKGGEKT